MTERERLIELLQKGRKYLDELECDECTRQLNCAKCEDRNIADYLLDNGVIVLPCKVGDTIYRCGDPIKKVYEWEIEHIELYFDEIIFVDDSGNEFTADDIGKTVFLTKEEAERRWRG